MKLKELTGDFISNVHDFIFYQDSLKIKARQIIDEIAQRTQSDIDFGLISVEELQELSNDPEFEKTYKRLWKLASKPEFELIFASMTTTMQDAIRLRHAEWLRRRWFPEEPQITLDFTHGPRLPSGNYSSK